VVFTGMQDRVSDLVSAMDVFVLPSNHVESFGNAVVEAMALGVPSIVFSDSPGICQHIHSGRTGFVVDDVDELGRLLARLRVRPDTRKSVGTAGADHIRATYSIGRSADGYARVYHKAMMRLARQ
jgi:glycosyltransferase involved in cell wall biosynthesis